MYCSQFKRAKLKNKCIRSMATRFTDDHSDEPDDVVHCVGTLIPCRMRQWLMNPSGEVNFQRWQVGHTNLHSL